LINSKSMSLFYWSAFPYADDCMMWENISECYVNLQITDIAKYNNKNYYISIIFTLFFL
jgi:hypothetical protein